MKELFLDANAHVPPSFNTLKKFNEINSSRAGHGHPMSLNKPGREAAKIIEESRTKIAELIGAVSFNQIIFTNGCTQACEWAIEILKNISNQDKTYHNILSSPLEHPAIKDPFEKKLSDNFINYCELDSFSHININKLCSSDYIICSHVQNEVGIIQPISDIKKKVKYLLSDMSQSLGKLSINITQLDVDIAIFGGHKFGGIGNVGFIYLKDPMYWIPFGTGSRYFTDRTGTPDVASIAATAFALEEAINTIEIRNKNSIEFKQELENGLLSRGWDIVCKNSNRIQSTTFAYLEGWALSKLISLSNNGIYCGLGSACGSHSSGLSHSLKALNYSGTSSDFMRISQFGEYTSEDAKYFLSILDTL